MNVILNYFIEANLGLVLFYCFYKLFLNEETSFSFNRTYLLGSIIISLLFPLISIGNASTLPTISTVIPPYYLPEIVITAEGKAAVAEAPTQALSFWLIIKWIYLTGFAFLLIRFFFQVGKLLIRIQSYRFENIIGNGKIMETNTPHPTFSFFNYIFIGNIEDLSEEEKHQIVSHEMVHAKKLHSIDILLVEILKIIFWFNPLIKNYKHSIIMVHEFQADADTVLDGDSKKYCNLLARVALMSADFKLANQFTNSLTLKRIKMLNAMKKKMSTWKLAVLLPVVVGFFFIVACQDQVMSEMSEAAKSSTMALEYPQEVQLRVDELKAKNPNGNFIVIEMNEEGVAKFNNLKVHSVELVEVKEKNNVKRNYLITDLNENVKKFADLSQNGEEVFTVVEETAKPAEGIDEFYKLITTNLKYPEQARKIGVQGKVFVEFIINEDGTLRDFQVLKGIGAGCDNEAMRVLALSKPWIPGKQRGKTVSQKMVMPITFKLSNGSVETGNVEPVNKKFLLETIHEKTNGTMVVKGVVKDEEGNPLPGMNVILNGTTLGTVSDGDGTFTLDTKQADGKVSFSFVGYETQVDTF